MSILDLIGNTPLININNIYIKMEMFNPTSSIKDRVAKAMILDFMQNKMDSKKYTMVEATSGNTGISVAMVCATLGLKCIIYAPMNTSRLKIKIMKAYGANVITQYNTITKCIKAAKAWGNGITNHYLDQFNNPINIKAQVKMAKEARLQYNEAINNTHWNEDFHSVDAIVVGVGTGGTLMGLHKVFPNATMFIVQVPDRDRIEGICDGVKLSLIPRGMTLGTITVSYVQAYLMSKYLAERYGIHCGLSSGANYCAAIVIQKKFKRILTVFPDNGVRYL